MSGIYSVNALHRYNLDDNNKIETSTGVVYFSQDLDLMRRVLIKVTRISGNNKKEIELSKKKAMAEVRAMVAIEEERVNIPKIYSVHFDENKSELCVVMEYIKGNTLRELISSANEENFIKWMCELSRILTVLERKRIYHKDIKPENIIIGPRNEVYLIDFDISVSVPNQQEGTIFYKAPEMDMGSKYPGREKCDMFAIGVMMYEYYTGKLPKRPIEYSADSEKFVWKKFIEPQQKNPEIDSYVNDIVVKCMKMNPKERYQNNNELANKLNSALRSIRNGRTTENNRTNG